jgi:apolipoprotein N-acyltransferase
MTSQIDSMTGKPRFHLPLPLQLLIAAIAGATHVFAFAPYGLWLLQFLVLMLFFSLLLHRPSIQRSALTTVAFGFGWYAFGMSWLFVSMHRYGGMPAWLAALAVVLLSLLLGSFMACMTVFGEWLRQRCALSRSAMLLLVLPAAFALGEWLRSWIFTGFPWIASGYAHIDSPLIGYAPVLGVYGVGWLVALTAGALLLARWNWRALALPLLIIGAGAGLTKIHWTTPVGKPISVRLLQGNVAQDLKFDVDHLKASLQMYRDLITAAPADLIATPETAIAVFPGVLPADYLPGLRSFAQQSGSALALGMPIFDSERQYSNSLLGMAPDGSQYRYDKMHLVPFGEFVPFGFRWFVDTMHIPLGDFTAGPALQQPFTVRDQRVLPNICYEDLFGEQIAAHLRSAQPATILLNISNIAWFGDTIALPQHLQASRMRAVETGRPMLRATNTGATAIIDARGHVQAQLAPFTQGVLSDSVQGTEGLTPYIRYGNIPIVSLCALILGAILFLRRRERRIAPVTVKNR